MVGVSLHNYTRCKKITSTLERIFNIAESPGLPGVVVQRDVDVPHGTVAAEEFLEVVRTARGGKIAVCQKLVRPTWSEDSVPSRRETCWATSGNGRSGETSSTPTHTHALQQKRLQR